MAAVPYFPHWTVPIEARTRFQPWACTFHTGDGGPRHFVVFGGRIGMVDAVHALLGPVLLKMHGGLVETVAERVDFDLDNMSLQGKRLCAVARALEGFIGSRSFVIDCDLVGTDTNKARLHLETMQDCIRNHWSVML